MLHPDPTLRLLVARDRIETLRKDAVQPTRRVRRRVRVEVAPQPVCAPRPSTV